ncbi:MAG: FAD-dependent oxidoreductase [Pirellulaceae bacterium]|nr:FAD-dependent oxidoreductase [Pirellulaceae bacterium]
MQQRICDHVLTCRAKLATGIAVVLSAMAMIGQPSAAARDDGLPRELKQGLVLWLRADRGVEVSGGRVVSWHDQSGEGHSAFVPDGFIGPTLDEAPPALVFSAEMSNESEQTPRAAGLALRIPSQVLPRDARELTVLAVGRANRPSSIGLFSIRNAARPLVQLDVDEHANARFIVRDGQSRTLSATTPCVLDARTIFGGVLRAPAANAPVEISETGQALGVHAPDSIPCSVQVLFGAERESGTAGLLALPWVDRGAWIGALSIPGLKAYSWQGSISEILVYDRALNEEQLEQAVGYLTKKHQLRPPVPTFLADSWNVLNKEQSDEPVAEELQADVCIVGGGSAGVGAAIAAAREGARVVLVERQKRLGGTGVNAFVSSWEPGPGCSIAEELFQRMKAIGGAGVARSQPVQTKSPMGLLLVSDEEEYASSLVRALPGDPTRRRVPFCVPYKPEAFDAIARQMLDETGNATVLDGTTFFRAEPNVAKTRVESVLAEDRDGRIARIRAKVFVDSTGDVWLARALGCEVMLGIDPKSRFDEPSAPEKGLLQLNAITRCYRIELSDAPRREIAPEAAVAFPRAAFVTGWKDGTRTVNMMPTLPGRALIDLGYDECMRRSEQIVRAHWNWLQQIPGFERYELAEIAPMLGIRESYRVVARYVLNEHDLRAGLPGQRHEDIIAVADHPCDIHGAGGHIVEVPTAYGVPYRCLIPVGPWENLLIACRGAGFSRIAASSVRLQRTMIQLGHAAGVAAAMAAKEDSPVNRIDVPRLVERLDAKSRYPIDESFVKPQ